MVIKNTISNIIEGLIFRKDLLKFLISIICTIISTNYLGITNGVIVTAICSFFLLYPIELKNNGCFILLSLCLSFVITIDSHIVGSFLGNYKEYYVSNFGLVDIVCFPFLFFFINCCCHILFDLYKKLLSLKWQENLNFSSRDILIFSCSIIFIEGILYCASYYPGIIYGDSLWSISQALGLTPYVYHHPIFYTFFIEICLQIGKFFSDDLNIGVLIYTLIQLMYMSFFTGLIITWIHEKTRSNALTIFSLLFFICSGYFALHEISMWKDGIFSITIAYLGLVLFNLTQKFSTKDLFIVSICIVISILSRANGIFVIGFILSCYLLVLIISKKADFKLIAYIFTLAVVTQIVVVSTISFLGIRSVKVEALGIPLQQVIRVAVYDGNMTHDEKVFINSVIPIETAKNVYTPGLVDKIKWNEQFNFNPIARDKGKEFLKVWANLLIKNPRIYIESWLLNTRGFWSIVSSEFYGFTGNVYMGSLGDLTKNDYYKDKIHSIKNELKQKLGVDISKFIPLNAETPPIGLIFWLEMFFLVIFITEKKTRMIVLLLPSFGVMASLFIATPIAYWPRYGLCLFYLVPVLLTIPFMRDRHCSEINKEQVECKLPIPAVVNLPKGSTIMSSGTPKTT